ncbi:4'-phosphopantetheinyl transferase superfamily protein [Streptomyces sp. HU2014]|uniref:4'-phosphopantetheinyl transferase family protein n=1 Tax=Streptomyces sp. HU2014 TaxID=2939414 RepID=UPI00200D802C|nr:4'-phosphopantetheinyl transferase superfamily protein [Streptomyces sp. HU2014]UQI45738.1 4'-phosphopantetheinyl transferase superfamily protein [Streptomyces sp. HU2014]
MPVRARPGWEGLLAPDEAARAEAIPEGGRRDLFVTSRAAQRLIACRYTGSPPRQVRVERTCERCGAGHGRPRVVGAGYEYSVAHTRHRVLVGVVAYGLVGIDLETIAGPGVPQGLLARTTTPDERVALSQLPPHELPGAFTRLWSRKEATVKLTGHGLAARLDRIGVRGDLALPHGSPAEDWPSSEVHLLDLFVEGHAAAIASTHRITDVRSRSPAAPATTD